MVGSQAFVDDTVEQFEKVRLCTLDWCLSYLARTLLVGFPGENSLCDPRCHCLLVTDRQLGQFGRGGLNPVRTE